MGHFPLPRPHWLYTNLCYYKYKPSVYNQVLPETIHISSAKLQTPEIPRETKLSFSFVFLN